MLADNHMNNKKRHTGTHAHQNDVNHQQKLLLDTLNSYAGWAKESGPQTHDHNSVKSNRYFKIHSLVIYR